MQGMGVTIHGPDYGPVMQREMSEYGWNQYRIGSTASLTAEFEYLPKFGRNLLANIHQTTGVIRVSHLHGSRASNPPFYTVTIP